MDRIDIWLAENGFGRIVRRESVGGGCINNSTRLHPDRGESLFLKQHDQPPENLFHTEAAGLNALHATNTLRVPRVIHVEEDFILLEDLGQGSPNNSYWQQLGTGLATMHGEAQARFGFTMDNYCGSTLQQNTRTVDGHGFFADYRILTLAAKAFHRQLLNREELSGLEFIAANLKRWIPDQPAALIHGDLWSGNLHCDEQGNPALIDPAAYWGWAEAELAMTRLFGGFSQAFYDSYRENSQLAGDWRERADLYNLFHLLNHLLLFGGSYLAPIKRIITRFA